MYRRIKIDDPFYPYRRYNAFNNVKYFHRY